MTGPQGISAAIKLFVDRTAFLLGIVKRGLTPALRKPAIPWSGALILDEGATQPALLHARVKALRAACGASAALAALLAVGVGRAAAAR